MSNPKLNFKADSSAKKTRSPPKKAEVEQSTPKKKKLKLDADKAAEKAQHLRFGKAELTPDELSRLSKAQKREMYAAAAARSAGHRKNDQYEEDNVGVQKQRFFSMFHTSDNTPLHLVFRADVRLPHIPVEWAGFQQLLMRTLCVDGSILHHNDVICVNNGRQPVCDHNQGLADS